MRAALPLLALAVLVLVAYAPADVKDEAPLVPADTTWTWPDNPEDLRVLPADTGPFELSQIMRGFTRALGVRCQHCHVGTEEMSLSEFDFVSEANPNKNIARAMLELVAKINDELGEIEGLHEAEGMRVTCYTCHRGDTTPETTPPTPRWRPHADEDGENGHDDSDDLEHEDGEDHDGGHDG